MKVIRQGEGPDPFADLASEAAALEQPAGQGEGGEPGGAQAGPAMPTNAEVIAQALAVVRDTLSAFAKVQSIKRTMNDETCKVLADVWAPVCNKHGVNLANMAGDYLPELRAAMTTAGIVTVAWSELRDEMRAMKATPVQPDAAPAASTDPAQAGG
jgi:hypothetical protein